VTRAYSPVLGLATAAFELAAATWAVTCLGRRRGRRAVVLLSALLFVLLAGYQIIEVIICWGGREPQLVLSRAAFIDVTWLPSLTLLLVAALYRPRSRLLAAVAWSSLAVAAVMAMWIVVDTRFVTGTICEVVHARYRNIARYFNYYGAFYEATQVGSAFIAAVCVARAEDRRDRRLLGDVLLGVLAYLIPSFMVGALIPGVAEGGLPSVMCHFALAYAIMLAVMLRREVRGDARALAAAPADRA
jgi:hypothetical protein